MDGVFEIGEGGVEDVVIATMGEKGGLVLSGFIKEGLERTRENCAREREEGGCAVSTAQIPECPVAKN